MCAVIQGVERVGIRKGISWNRKVKGGIGIKRFIRDGIIQRRCNVITVVVSQFEGEIFGGIVYTVDKNIAAGNISKMPEFDGVIATGGADFNIVSSAVRQGYVAQTKGIPLLAVTT